MGLLLLLGACRQTPHVQTMPALGPGAPMTLAVPGARALAPSIAARSPYVAVSFTTSDSRGAMVYLATSDDNGATFSSPLPISDDGGAQSSSVHTRITDDASVGAQPPQVRVEWTRADGTRSARALNPWKAGRKQQPITVPSRGLQATATCTPDGEVLLVAGQRGPLDVSVNHRLAEETCASRVPAALIDARQWAHVAWIAGADDEAARVLYAASSDREWFGGAQEVVAPGQRPAHLTMVTDPNDTVVMTWDGDMAGRRHVFLRQLLPAHHGTATLLPQTRLSTDGGGVEPATASITGGVVVAWREPATGTIVVRRVGLDAICETTPAPTAGAPAAMVSAR
ncbi:MAG: hypothetical protein U0Q11_07805 [Vicinamibacterales bacterium]